MITSGFSDVFEGTINSIDIQLNNPEISNNQSFFNVNNYTKIKSMEILKFIEKNVYVKFIINKHFSCVDINCGLKYMSYEKYSSIFNKIINKVYEDNNIKIKRIGFRKLNEFFMTSEKNNNIMEYLNDKFYKYNYDFIKEEKSDIVNDLITERKYTFAYNEKQVNLVTHLSQGMLAGKNVNRAAIDIDVSINDLEILRKIIEDKKIIEKLNEINKIIFKIFKNMLSEKFLNILIDENEVNNNLIGVGKNE